MNEVIDQLITEGYLKTPRIIKAFQSVRRKDFLPEEMRDQANLNIPLPIRFGQTISQPLTVAFMLELLQPEEGDIILDVGTGSGWQAALLATIVGKNGKVFGIERIPQLARFGQNNCKPYGFSQLEIKQGDGTRGWEEHAPFDKIIIAAAGIEIPHALIAQLKNEGRLVMPVGEWEQSMTLLTKDANGTIQQKEHPGFQFVPLIEERNV